MRYGRWVRLLSVLVKLQLEILVETCRSKHCLKSLIPRGLLTCTLNEVSTYVRKYSSLISDEGSCCWKIYHCVKLLRYRLLIHHDWRRRLCLKWGFHSGVKVLSIWGLSLMSHIAPHLERYIVYASVHYWRRGTRVWKIVIKNNIVIVLRDIVLKFIVFRKKAFKFRRWSIICQLFWLNPFDL